jgi:hypothetical protein
MSEQFVPDVISFADEQGPTKSIEKPSLNLNKNENSVRLADSNAASGVLLQPFEADPKLCFRTDMMIRDTDVPFLFIAKKIVHLLAKSSVQLTEEGYFPNILIEAITSTYLPKYNDLSIGSDVRDQSSFPTLHACLTVLQLGGWIRKYQGALSLTKKGKQKHKQLRGTKHNAWFLTELLQIYREQYDWQSELVCTSELEALESLQRAFPELIYALWQANNKEVDSTWLLAAMTEPKSEFNTNPIELNHVLVEHFFIRFAWRFGLVIKPKLGTNNVLIRQSKLFSRWILLHD